MKLSEQIAALENENAELRAQLAERPASPAQDDARSCQFRGCTNEAEYGGLCSKHDDDAYEAATRAAKAVSPAQAAGAVPPEMPQAKQFYYDGPSLLIPMGNDNGYIATIDNEDDAGHVVNGLNLWFKRHWPKPAPRPDAGEVARLRTERDAERAFANECLVRAHDAEKLCNAALAAGLAEAERLREECRRWEMAAALDCADVDARIAAAVADARKEERAKALDQEWELIAGAMEDAADNVEGLGHYESGYRNALRNWAEHARRQVPHPTLGARSSGKKTSDAETRLDSGPGSARLAAVERRPPTPEHAPARGSEEAGTSSPAPCTCWSSSKPCQKHAIGRAPASSPAPAAPLTGAELEAKYGFEPVPDYKKDPFVRPMRKKEGKP